VTALMSKASPKLDRRELLALGGATVVVFGVAAIFLGHRQLWIDESFSWEVSRLSLGGWLRFSFSPHGELNMALDNLLLRPFDSSHLSDLWMRVPSLVAMVATVPLVWLVADRLSHSRFVRVTAVAIFITQAGIVDFAFEARSYAPLVFGVTGVTLLLLMALEGSRRAGIAYVLTLPLLVGLHFLALYVIAAHVLALLVITPGRLGRRIGETLRYTGLGLVVGLGSLFVFARQGNREDAAPVTMSLIVHTAYDLTGRAGPLSLLFGVAAIAGVALLVHRRQTQPEGLIVVATIVVPVGLAVLASASRPMVGENYQLYVVPLLCCSAAIGIGAVVRDRRLRIVTVAAFVVLGLVGQALVYRSPSREEPDTVAAFVLAHRGPDDVVAFSAPTVEIPYHRYIVDGDRTSPPEVGAVARPGSPDQTVTETSIARATASLAPGASIWLVVRRPAGPDGSVVGTKLAGHGLEVVASAHSQRMLVQQWRRRS
jgi:hypothetical protein